MSTIFFRMLPISSCYNSSYFIQNFKITSDLISDRNDGKILTPSNCTALSHTFSCLVSAITAKLPLPMVVSLFTLPRAPSSKKNSSVIIVLLFLILSSISELRRICVDCSISLLLI